MQDEKTFRVGLISLLPYTRSYQYSLATSYLKSYALSKDAIAERCQIDLITALAESVDCVKTDHLLKNGYDLVGFSCYMWNLPQVLKFVEGLKRQHPETMVVLGGPSVSHDSEDLLEKAAGVDIIVAGEGEVPFAQIIEARLLKTRSLASVDGICFHQNGHTVFVPQKKHVAINTIPSPFTNGIVDIDRVRSVYYESYRGCIQNCSYCLWGKYKSVRFFDLDRVKADLTTLYRSKSISEINIIDSAANHPPGRFIQILEHISRLNNPKIQTYFHIDIGLLTQEVIDALETIPKGNISLGLQSANTKALLLAKRKSNLYDIKRVFKKLQQSRLNQIELYVDLIFGLPGDSFDDIMASIDFVLSHGFIVNSNVLFVLPGCHYDRHADHYGLCYDKDPPYEIRCSNDLTGDELVTLKKYVYVLDLMKEYMIRIVLIQLAFVSKYSLFTLLKRFFDQFELEQAVFYASLKKQSSMLTEFSETILKESGREDMLLFFSDLVRHVANRSPAVTDMAPANRTAQTQHLFSYDFSHFDSHSLRDTVCPITPVRLDKPRSSPAAAGS